MDHLEALLAAPRLAEAAHGDAALEPVLLRAREVEEAQGQRAGAVGDPRQQLAPATERDLGELDLALVSRDHARRGTLLFQHGGYLWSSDGTASGTVEAERPKLRARPSSWPWRCP